jgi:hypothetical protein
MIATSTNLPASRIPTRFPPAFEQASHPAGPDPAGDLTAEQRHEKLPGDLPERMYGAELAELIRQVDAPSPAVALPAAPARVARAVRERVRYSYD